MAFRQFGKVIAKDQHADGLDVFHGSSHLAEMILFKAEQTCDLGASYRTALRSTGLQSVKFWIKKGIGYICRSRAAIDHRALLGTTMIDASGREAERFLAFTLESYTQPHLRFRHLAY